MVVIIITKIVLSFIVLAIWKLLLISHSLLINEINSIILHFNFINFCFIFLRKSI